jgi:M6 family metalloprotease-like protein
MKKSRLIPLVLLGVLPLTSCYVFNPKYNLGNNSSSSETNTTEYIDFGTPETKSNYSKDNLNVTNIGAGYGYHYLPSTGDSKILVIPVQVTDYTFETQYGKNYETTLNNVFFGDSDDTGWESVSSYYYKSSYGKLLISGEIAPTITINMTMSELTTAASKYDGNGSYTDDIVNQCVKYLSQNSDIDLSEYDSDSDGYIDAIWMVYSMPYSRNSSFLWAYTTWTYENQTYDNVSTSCYSWASYQFLMQQDYRTMSKPSYTTAGDAHTYIHETGHMMGLDDYYSYDYGKSNNSGSKDTPVGGIDMMDYNIGDHTAYSKYVLGWIKPDVITKEYLESNNYNLTLSSLTEKGKAFLLPIYKDGTMDYNGTPFDEYLLIEYYTPTNLNETDTKGYGSSKVATYKSSGVLVYHIDARIGKIVATSNSETTWDGNSYDSLPKYGSDIRWGRTYTYTYIFNNTKSYCQCQSLDDSNNNYYRGRLISLLPKSAKKIQGTSDASSLYRTGSSFDSSNYSSFMFDDGSKPLYGFSVKSTSTTDCVLEFSDF